MAEKELFEESGCLRISNETSYRSRSSLVITKLEITCLENNEAEKLVSNEPVATKNYSCMCIPNMQPYQTASFFITLFISSS